MLLEKLRRNVLETACRLSAYGLVWMAGGTAAARDPESGYIVVTPSGLSYAELTPADMIVVDLQMTVVDGEHRPSVATNLWLNFFNARSDIHGLIHTHSPYATAFSVTYQPIPVVTETMADWFGAEVPVARYAHIEDPWFSTAPVDAMAAGFAVLLGQHGPITVGKTLDDALERAVTLEESAKIYTIAQTIGSPHCLTPAQAERSFEYYHNRYGQKKTRS
jgi:L-ribulose-5-phosphate 4-epimerase